MLLLLALPAIAVSVALFCCSDTVSAVQSIPYKMNFQGRVTNASGTTLANGTYNMKFRIYSAASGGTLLWSEQRAVSAGTGVSVANGLFSVQLGDVTSLSPTIFNNANPIYFEIEMPTPATATCSTASCESYTEGAMTPRNQLGSSAYAFNSDTVDGLDSSVLARKDTANTFTSSSTFSGTSLFSVNDPSAVGIQSTSGTKAFTADTSNMMVQIGSSTADATSVVFVLDTKNTAGDPTGAQQVAGSMYYNSTSGKFRCYQGAVWIDCITAAPSTQTLQTVYDASSSPATITTTASKGVNIVAGAAPTADLFVVDNTANPTVTGGVNGVSVKYAGGAAAAEGSGLRVDYTPGSTSGGTWSGVRIVANATGPASGVTAYGIKLEGPSSPGAGTEVGLRVASGFDIGLDIASGGLQFSSMTDPSAPAASNLRVYAQDIAGRMLLKMKGPSGLDTPFQPALFTNNVAMLLPSTGTTVTVWGMQNTTVGTASTPTITSADMANMMRRVRVTSATTANSASELRSTQPLVGRGSVAGLGGFFYAVRFSINSTTANQRLFSGLTAATGATSTSAAPSSLVNMVGVGWDSTDANLQIMSNDNTGTATKVDLGSSFPTNTTAAVYELIMFAPPNGSTIGYRVTRLDTGAVTSGTLSSDLPQNTVVLTHHQYMNNGGTAAAVVLDVNKVYIESDY